MLSKIRQAQKVPYDFTYVASNEQNKLTNRNTLIDTENRLTAVRRQGVEELGEKGKGSRQENPKQNGKRGCQRGKGVGERQERVKGDKWRGKET